MSKSTPSTGARVALDGHLGYVRETTVPSVNTVLVEFDTPIPGNFTRHAFVFASDLTLVDDDPLESHDAANGALWPRTVEEAADWADDLGVDLSKVFFALKRMRERRPDYQRLEAAHLADPEADPAGDDL